MSGATSMSVFDASIFLWLVSWLILLEHIFKFEIVTSAFFGILSFYSNPDLTVLPVASLYVYIGLIVIIMAENI